MLRHIDQHEGGVKVYTRELLRTLIRINPGHKLFLLFREHSHMDEYAHAPNVESVVLNGGSRLFWDQVAVPRAAKRLGLDVLFNPKYSIPLKVHCKTAWVCHGLDWYVMPQASRAIDRLNHKFLIPRYARKADAVLAVSETTREHVLQYLDVAPDRVHTVYLGLSEVFHHARSANARKWRERLQLPERFVLYCGAVYPPKNFRRLVQAYARVGPAMGVSLVIAGGTNRFLSEDELHEPERLGLGHWVKRVGWLDNRELPALYESAQALLLPSLYESVGLPIIEAMACGCPVVTADRYGTKELGGGAAVLVNPDSVDAIAAGIHRVLTDEALRARITEAGRERARHFTWERTAEETLRVLENLVSAPPAGMTATDISATTPRRKSLRAASFSSGLGLF
ncbi:MAG: glycosyltransferase family 1 protein [Steroidobacteraceae bacterium]